MKIILPLATIFLNAQEILFEFLLLRQDFLFGILTGTEKSF